MSGRKVAIYGFPRSMNNVKLKLCIESASGSNTIDKIDKDQERVVCTFKNEEGLRMFLDANLTETEFGGQTYPLEIDTIVKEPIPVEEDTSVPPLKKIAKLNPNLQQFLYENTNYWSTLQQLPAEGGTMCILAQNIDPAATIQAVKLHFESKKRAKGGPVAGLIRLPDGLLVIFENSNDCLSCSEMADQKIGDRNIVIFPKMVPEYYERKFVIKGVKDQTEVDTLTLYLESCSINETTPKACIKQSVPGVYLIEYGKDFDVAETPTLLKKITELEGSKLHAKVLLKTDCLKVLGISDSVTNDRLKLTFENRKRTDGGPVTRIDRLPNQAALVYFALFRDAERVYEKSHLVNGLISINEQPLSVQLYHPALSNDHNNIVQDFQTTPEPVPESQDANKPLEAFQCDANFDKALLDNVLRNQIHKVTIEKHLKKFALFEAIPQDDERIVLRFTPQKVHNSKLSQKDFKETCLTRLDNFLKRYSVIEKTYDDRKLKQARDLKLYPELQDFKGDNITISWSPNEPKVVVSGLRDVVDQYMKQIDNHANRTVATSSFTEDHFKTFLHCGVASELRKAHPDIQVQWDENTKTVTYSGQSEDVHQAQLKALTLLMTDKKKITGVDEMVLKFLSESMQQSTEIASKTQGELKKANVKAFIGIDDDPFIKAQTSDDYQRAINVIKNVIVTDNMRPHKDKMDVVKTQEWKTFEKTLGGSGLYGFYVTPADSILLVGVKSEVKVARAKIDGFMNEHAILSYFINMDYGKARFAIEKAPAFTPEICKRYEITCGLSSDDGGGVVIRGKKKSLDYAQPEMVKLWKTILEGTIVLERPGMKEFFQSNEGKEFLSNTERINRVIILADSNQCKEWVKANGKSAGKSIDKKPTSASTSADMREKEICSIILPNSTVKVCLWKTDITRHKCEAIVNTSNEDLKLLPGGISGVILKFDATRKIQDEMADHISNNGKLLPGEAVITTAGDLTNCKKIVHVVGPRWHAEEYKHGTDPKLILKACVARGLEITDNDNLKSIAIPAISCGVFGGKIPVCIPLIVAAVEEYFADVKNTSIKEVHFVEYSSKPVLDAFTESLKGYKPAKEVPTVKQKPRKTAVPQPSQSTAAAAQGSIHVKLVTGDISMQKTDVIVNVTNPQHLTNMGGGPVIGRVLGQKAGQTVLQECTLLPPPHNVGDVFETNAGGLQCKKLYHALVDHYDPQNSPSILQSVMAQSLQKADRAGFSSITFPAIATGGFKHPPQFVAKIMKQEIENFNGRNLQNVVIVLYQGSPNVISAFHTEFNSQSPPSPEPPKKQTSQYSFNQHKHKQPTKKTQPSSTKSSFQKLDDFSGTFGQLVISLCKGDITNQDSDVIVNSTNHQFMLDQGQVSKKILSKAGKQIQGEAQSKAKSGYDYVVTSGGNMKCKKIIHLVSPDDPKDLPKRIAKVLHEVEKQKMKSVCLPAFGTGMLNLAVDTVGSIMRTSIEEFAKKNTKLKYLEMISIVLYDDDKLEKFKTGFFNPSSKKGILETLMGWKDQLTGLFSSPAQESPVDPVTKFTLYLYSNVEDDINRAEKCIHDEVNRNSTKQVITDSVISRLTDWERFEILEIVNKYRVKIEEKSDRYLKRLILEGLLKEVTTAREEINGILRDFAQAETTSAYISWEKKVNDQWEKFSPRSAHILEKAFKSRAEGGDAQNMVRVPEFQDGKVGHTTVNLAILDGKQGNTDGNQKGQSSLKIRRRIVESRSSSDFPDFWDDMKGKVMLTVRLDPNSTEYGNVVQKLQAGGAFYTQIVSIERVQNASLYKQYQAKKSEVANKLKNFSKPIDQQLFHGTGDDDQIVIHGFDRSYAGKNATVYGRGVYFAASATYSHRYAPPNQQGQRRMFVADVITGDYCVGNQNITAPPSKPNSSLPNDIYDSVVDNAMNPSIFVIFKDASAYPAYRVTYS